MESERKKDQTNFYMVAAWLLPLLYTHLCKNNFRTWLRAYSLRVWGHRYAHEAKNKYLILSIWQQDKGQMSVTEEKERGSQLLRCHIRQCKK